MAFVVTRAPADVTVHARCDTCGDDARREGLTAGAAIDKLELAGWGITLRTSAALCPEHVRGK